MTVLDHNSQALIAERCRTLVPGVEVIESDGEPIRVCVTARGMQVEFRWLHLSEEWVATAQGFDDDIVCAELSDVVYALWEAFGGLVYPTVLWEVLDADATSTDNPIWGLVLDVLTRPKESLGLYGAPLENRRATRMYLAVALESREVEIPMDLVIEAVAMATPTHRMHKDWCRPTIGPEDRERICP